MHHCLSVSPRATYQRQCMPTAPALLTPCQPAYNSKNYCTLVHSQCTAQWPWQFAKWLESQVIQSGIKHQVESGNHLPINQICYSISLYRAAASQLHFWLTLPASHKYARSILNVFITFINKFIITKLLCDIKVQQHITKTWTIIKCISH